MKLTFLGSGSAFTDINSNFHSNMLLESPTHKRLLIDCGTDIRHSLQALHLSYSNIDSVYISHLHFDHVGGLEWLAFSTYFNHTTPRPKLFIHPSMVEPLWNNVLSGGLQSLEGETSATLDTYFDLPPIRDGKFFTWESINFEMIKTIHVSNAKDLLPSYGLFFSIGETKIFLSTDMQFTPERYMNYYQNADVIFHECETDEPQSGVHSHFKQLLTLDSSIKAKMWLYHYSDKKMPDAKNLGFKGFVKRGQAFHFED